MQRDQPPRIRRLQSSRQHVLAALRRRMRARRRAATMWWRIAGVRHLVVLGDETTHVVEGPDRQHWIGGRVVPPQAWRG